MSLGDAPTADTSVSEPSGGVIARGATSGLTYALMGIAQRGLIILLLPIFALALPPAEYGQIAVVTAIGGALVAALGFGLEAVITRSAVALRVDPARRAEFVNSVGLFLLVVPVTVAAATGAVLSVPSVLSWLGVSAGPLMVGLLAAGMQTSLTVFAGALLRAEERRRAYVVVTSAFAVLNIGLIALFVLGLRLGVTGWMLGNLGAALAALVIGLRLIGHRWTTVVSVSALRTALALGLPLLPHAISHWGLGLSDRLLLAGLTDTVQVGIYNLAYQIAAPIGLIVVALNQGVTPIYAEAATSSRSREGLTRLATYQVLGATVLGAAVAVLGPPLTEAVFPSGYADAGLLVPWIALGYVLFGLYLLPANEITMMLGKTQWMWVPTAAAAGVNVALNVLLIPTLGSMAAAIDTAIAYGVLLAGVMVYRHSLDGPRVRPEWAQMGLGILWIVAAAGAAVLASVGATAVAAIGIRATVIGFATLLLVVMLKVRPWSRAAGPRGTGGST